jgi:hypothetical protein
MPSVALEFEDLFKTDDDGASDEPTTDFVAKFIADAELSVALGGDEHVARLEKETALIDARADKIYKGIAAKVTGATSQTLAKNSPSASNKVREEITRYSSGAEVVAELNEHGEVIRTYSRNGAA